MKLKPHVVQRKMDWRGWTQPDLARASGLSLSLISKYMRDKTPQKPKSIRKIADALEVQMDVIASLNGRTRSNK